MQSAADNPTFDDKNKIASYFECMMISPRELDLLLERGFRHFGTLFFAYNISERDNEIFHVIPLRVNLQHFQLTKSQKRILHRNRDLEVVFRDAYLDSEKERLFHAHIKRFKKDIPESLNDFLSPVPSMIPCHTLECCVFLKGELIAVGFMDVGENSTSCVYTAFDTTFSKRSLGIFVILQEIKYSMENGKSYVYHGYAYREDSFYDYKKNFAGLECYDWNGKWAPLAYSNGAK